MVACSLRFLLASHDGCKTVVGSLGSGWPEEKTNNTERHFSMTQDLHCANCGTLIKGQTLAHYSIVWIQHTWYKAAVVVFEKLEPCYL